MQGALFSVSNVLIQSSLNFFGAAAMAGNTASGNIEGFAYTAMNAIHQTSLSFTSQNLGAGKIDRIKKVFFLCILFVIIIGATLSLGMCLGAEHLIPIYSSSQEVIEYGVDRLVFIGSLYFLCGIMEVIVGVIRGLGASFVPTIISLLGACVFRVAWIYTVFESHKTLETLFISYPISWTLTILGQLIFFCYIYKKIKKTFSSRD